MGVYVAVASKKGSLERWMNDILEREVLDRSLHFDHIGREVYFSGDRRAVLINFAAPNPRFVTPKMQFFASQEGACALHGNVVEQVMEPADLALLGAEDLLKLLGGENGMEGPAFRGRYTGDYSYVTLSRDGKIRASCDVIPFQPVYYAQDDEFVYISNRQRCIRNLMKDARISLSNLACMMVMGNLLGTDTPIEQIVRLEGNGDLRWDGERLHVDLHPDWFLEKLPGEDMSKSLAENVTVCSNRLNAVLKGADQIDLPLTGGRDSRVNLALLIKAGLKDKVHTYTNGFEKHPDVVVARQISAHYGIPHTFHKRVAPATVSADTIIKKIMGSAFQSDGSLGAWDGYAYTFKSEELYFPGHASAAFKSHAPAPILTYEDVEDFNAHRFCRNDYIKDEAKALVRRRLRSHIDHYRDLGVAPIDIADGYMVTVRMPNWHAHMVRQNDYAHHQMQILNNENLYRLSMAYPQIYRRNLWMHYSILKEIDPFLVETAFADHGWNRELGTLVHDGLKIDTPAVPTPKGMPFYGSWQMKLNESREFRLRIWDILSSYDHSAFWDLFDRRSAEAYVLDRQFSVDDLRRYWNFIGGFFFYHGLELPIRVTDKNRLIEKEAFFETRSGIRGRVIKYPIEKLDDQDAAKMVNDNLVYAESAHIDRAALRDDEKYHHPVDDHVLDFLTLNNGQVIGNVKDPAAYLQDLSKGAYLVFITARGKCPVPSDEKVKDALRSLGLTGWDVQEQSLGSYGAVVNEGTVVFEERKKGASVRSAGEIDGVAYDLRSADPDAGCEARTYVNEALYRSTWDGVQVVVYDKRLKKVTDTIYFPASKQYRALVRNRLFRENPFALAVRQDQVLSSNAYKAAEFGYRVKRKLKSYLPGKH